MPTTSISLSVNSMTGQSPSYMQADGFISPVTLGTPMATDGTHSKGPALLPFGATLSAGKNLLLSAVNAIAAAGTTQATATALTGQINVVSTAAASTGVNLPASAAGLQVVVVNNGANALLVYPAQGAADTINGIAAANGVILYPGSTGMFNCAVAGTWTAQPLSTGYTAINTNTATAGATLTAANIVGGASSVDLAMTGVLGAGANIQLPTVAAMVQALQIPKVGTSYRLRITNQSSANFAWTVTTNTGWTLAGTMSIAQNTWREFVINLASLTTATITSAAVGTYS